MEGEINSQEKNRLARRKRITINLELQKKPNGYPVNLRITEDGKHKRFKSTVELKRKEDWDPKHQRIKPSEQKWQSWQKVLDDLKEKALTIQRELEQAGMASADKIIEELRYGAHSESFLVYAEQKVADCRAAGRLSSMNKYAQVCRKFIAFMESRGREPYSVTFKEIDYSFIADFDAFMQSLDNKQYMAHGDRPDSVSTGAKKLHPNYIAKVLQYMNTIFESAEKARLIKHEDNPFNSYKIKTVKTDREELTLEEVQRIVHLELEDGSGEWHSRNFFLFAMYCAGIRIGDVLCLRWNNVTDDNRLHYQMSKNHKIQDIPLLPPAIEILDMYRTPDAGPDDFVFPYMKTGKYAELWQEVKSLRDFDLLSGDMKLKYKQTVSTKEAQVNNGLRKIRDKAGINKPLSTHIARHTFARLAKEVHIDNALLQGLLQHSDLATTEKYMGRFSTDARDEALKEVFRPLAPEMLRKNDLLKQLAELPEEDLAAMLEEYQKKKGLTSDN
jgi:integrase